MRDRHVGPRVKAPTQRRLEIMNAARSLFVEQGVAVTTIEQITMRAAVAKGTFYLYFSSREEILEALRAAFAEDVLEEIGRAVADVPEGDVGDKLAAWLQGCIRGYLRSIKLHDAIFYEARPPARGGLVDNELVDDLARLLRTAGDDEAWPTGDSHVTAIFLFGGLHGLIENAARSEGGPDEARLYRQARDLSLRLVAPGK